MFSFDLKDAYFQVPIYLDSCLYPQFVVEGQVFQFLALCFSLSSAPQVFTKVFWYPGIWTTGWWWRSLFPFFFVTEILLQLCRELGIVINWEKSDLIPSRCVQHLSMVINISREKVFPSDSLVSQFLGLAASFLVFPSSPAKMWQQLLGHMASLERFVPRGCSRMCPLQWRVKDHWSPMVGDPSLPVPLAPECVGSIRWWPQEGRWDAGIPLQVLPPSLLLHTDASLLGWGTNLLDLTASRVWLQEKLLHINTSSKCSSLCWSWLPFYRNWQGKRWS